MKRNVARWVLIPAVVLPIVVAANEHPLECVVPEAAPNASDTSSTRVQLSASSAQPGGRMPLFNTRNDRSDKRPDFSMVFCADAQGGASAGSTSELERTTRRCVF